MEGGKQGSSLEYQMSYGGRPFTGDTAVKTLPEILRLWAESIPDEEAFVFASSDGSREVVTWKQLLDSSVKFAQALVALGVKKGDVVGMKLRSSPTWLAATFGAMFAGAIPVSIAFTYKDGSDVIAVLNKIATCTTFILDPSIDDTTWAIFKGFLDSVEADGTVKSKMIPSLKYLICASLPADATKVLTMEELLGLSGGECELPVVTPEDVAMMFQTSGSTGIPKAAVHTYRSLYFLSIIGRTMYDSKDKRIYNDRPFGYIGGWPWIVYTGETRITSLGSSTVSGEEVLQIIQKERCQCILVLPPVLQQMISKKESVGKDWTLNTLITGGQPISKQFTSCLGSLCSTFVCGYGSTELLACLRHATSRREDFVDYSCGIPLEGTEIKLVNDAGETVPVNTRGEIYVKSLGMFAGYVNAPEKTQAVFTADGWYKTDDIGHMTEDGHFFVEGRKSDVILSGGFNVYPSALEALLKSCPGVYSAAIVPVPDDVYFQVICACVVRQPGNDVTEDVLRHFCEDAHNDKRRVFTVIPTYYLFFESFPLTQTGKTSKLKLTELAVKRIQNK